MVPKLEYKDTDHDGCEREKACRFVDNSLKLHRAPVLETLRICLREGFFNSVNFRKCVIPNAVDRYVRVLELKLRKSRRLTKLPKSLYTCKTLVELTLSHDILVDVPSSACLPSLKNLLLFLVVYKDEDSLFRLLSSCSLLARSPIRFSIAESWTNPIRIKNVLLPCIRVFCRAHDKFRRSLSLVTSLTLCLTHRMAVNFNGITFSQLQRFKMSTSFEGWSELLLRILDKSPQLQFLHLHSKYQHYHSLSWMQPRFVPSCLSSHLKVFKWTSYGGRRDENRLMSYIYANSKCLKKATMTLKTTKSNNIKEENVKTLTSMFRVSTMSQLLIKDRLSLCSPLK